MTKLKQQDFNNWSSWDWALAALEEFRLRVGHGDTLHKTDQLTLALVGKSQVGKTSLALRLLGVSPKWISEIGTALRGGRDHGKSATPVVTIYETSEERPSQKMLEAISNTVIEARSNSPKFIKLKIPAAKGCVARVVDLVGVESANNHEDTLAQHSATEWLYQADVHVFVSRMDHISDLIKTHDLDLARILHFWQVNPATSILVLTNAFETVEAIKHFSKLNDPTDLLEAARKRCSRLLLTELSNTKNGYSFREDQLPRIAPVCLKNPTKSQELASQKATEMALKSIEQLANTDPIRFRVRAGFSLPKVLQKELGDAENVLRVYQENLKKTKIEWKKKQNAINSDIDSHKIILKELEAELSKFNNDQKELLEFNLKGNNQILIDDIKDVRNKFLTSKDFMVCTKWNEFRVQINFFLDQMEKVTFHYIKNKLSKNSKTLLPRELDSKLRNSILQKIKKMRTDVDQLKRNKKILFFKIPWFSPDCTIEAISKWTYSSVNTIIKTYNNTQSDLIKKEIDNVQKEMARKTRRINSHLKHENKCLNKAKKDQLKLRLDRSEWDNSTNHKLTALKHMEKLADKAVIKSNSYADLLKNHFISEWNGIISTVNLSQNPDTTLIGLGRLCGLSNTLKQLIKMQEEDYDGENKD